MLRQAPLEERSIQYVKGVGPARAQQLKRLGIQSVADALLAVPRRYEDRSRLVTIRELVPGQLATLRARVLAKSLRRIRTGRALVEAALGDATGVVYGVWFNQPYLAAQLRVGQELILHGQVERVGRRLQMVHPELERADGESNVFSLHTGRIVPIYPLTEGISQRWFRGIVRTILTHSAASAPEVLASEIRERHHLKLVAWALEQIHFPDDWETLAHAQRRLAFEELFVMQLRLALRRARWTSREKPRRYQREGPLMEAFRRRLTFTLTASQHQVLEELLDDLCRPVPMLRLLQGDVGCGKTVVAAFLIAVVVQSGYQVALMVPTELLAEQHRRVLAGYFDPLGVSVRLLSQAVSARGRKPLTHAIAHGTVDVVVGTHALLESAVSFPTLGLVIIDEQHKFGVVQRSTLARKAHEPDVLVMTATPIPRTLALSVYGDLACSTVTELPPGRLPVRTVRYREADRAQVYRLIREELRQGRQGYVVYPLVEAQDRRDIKAATQMANQLKTRVFPEYAVELLHGQMRPKEKETVMRAFVEGRVQLLVSTVIVEVGLDVPNATVMLIEHPERFGLAQLHQLRGRIGRGTQPATCFLLSETTDEAATKRLAAFVETTDGFRLAEQDLESRGPGELLGRQQHGWLHVRIARLTRDRDVLDLARQEAFALVQRNPQLAGEEWTALRRRVETRLGRAG